MIATAPAMSPELIADHQRWLERKAAQDRKNAEEMAKVMPPFADLARNPAAMQMLAKRDPAAVDDRPEDEADLADRRARTLEDERLMRFRRVCPPEFMAKINTAMLINPAAFERVAQWNGTFPGPCAFGSTGTAKTRAAWSAIGRLWVRENRPFAWFPVKRLVTEFERYESKGLADEFWANYSAPRFSLLFVDDVDKINWQFESQMSALFSFYDWIYRAHIPCISTTNKPREWWAEKMGEAFVRRLFNEAHFEVKF